MSKEPSKEVTNVWNKVFDEINNFVMPFDPSNPPEGFACLNFPGETVIATDYDPQNAVNKSNICAKMNRIPKYCRNYVDSGKTVSGLAEQILSAYPPKVEEYVKARQQIEHDKARNVIDKHGDAYYQYKRMYNVANRAYLSVKNRPDVTEVELLEKEQERNTAFDLWNGLGYKTTVDGAIAITKRLTYTAETVQSALITKLANAESSHFEVVFSPNNWVDPDKLSWTNVAIKRTSKEIKKHNTIDKFSYDKSVNVFWVIYKGADRDTKTEDKLNEATNMDALEFTFEIARVDIIRDWFPGDFLTYAGLWMKGRSKGSLCAGSLEKAKDSDYLSIPTGFIVARNINIYGEFGTEVNKFLKTFKESHEYTKAGFGIYSFDKKTSTSTETSEKSEFSGKTKITTGPRMQIIGYINSVLPPFPTADHE